MTKKSLSTKEGMERFLVNLPFFASRRYYQSDLEASELLSDVELAIKKAKLTPLEHETVERLYYQDQTQTIVAKEMDCAVSMVYKRKEKAVEKIAAVFAAWGYDNDVYL
jgi:DNA-directed RNA polymerase specialized sigma24 family protein